MCYPISAGPSLLRQPCTHMQDIPIFPICFSPSSNSSYVPHALRPSVPTSFLQGHGFFFWDTGCLNFLLLIKVSPYFFTLITLKLGTSRSKTLHLDPEITSPHLFLATLLCPTPLGPFYWPVPSHLHPYLKDISAPTVISLSYSPPSPTLP